MVWQKSGEHSKGRYEYHVFGSKILLAYTKIKYLTLEEYSACCIQSVQNIWPSCLLKQRIGNKAAVIFYSGTWAGSRGVKRVRDTTRLFLFSCLKWRAIWINSSDILQYFAFLSSVFRLKKGTRWTNVLRETNIMCCQCSWASQSTHHIKLLWLWPSGAAWAVLAVALQCFSVCSYQPWKKSTQRQREEGTPTLP